jgi:hypothetical protein
LSHRLQRSAAPASMRSWPASSCKGIRERVCTARKALGKE